MPIEVRVPQVLRRHTDGAAAVAGDGASVEALLAGLARQYPGLVAGLLDDSGLRRYVNLYVGGADIRFGAGLATALRDGDVVTILPAGAPETPAS